MLPATTGGRLFAAILVATLIASALVVTARTPDLALEVTERTRVFTPNGDGKRDVARLTYFVRESDPAATVQIVGPDLKPARTFADQEPVEANQEMTLVWDGRTDSGRPAPSDRYRLRVVLPGADRDMVFPRRLELRR